MQLKPLAVPIYEQEPEALKVCTFDVYRTPYKENIIRMRPVKKEKTVSMNCAQNAHAFIISFFTDITHHESFYVLALNRNYRLIGYKLIGVGGIASTTVDIKLIMQYLLLVNAQYYILTHNHPSGSLAPSEHDKDTTEKIGKASAYFDMKMVDHIIITEDNYYSMKDNGII